MLQPKQHQQLEEEQASIKNLLFINPKIKQTSETIEVADYLLPYSVGIEIECGFDVNVTSTIESKIRKIFHSISNIIEVDVNNTEQRFRIPNGINGLICLFEISYNLKKYHMLNPSSGIHYHIDCSDVYKYFNNEVIKQNSHWILNELDSWNYKGSYNKRLCTFSMSHNWVRFQKSFKTMEYRIGEMTFDYHLLLTRIHHASSITSRLKEYIKENCIDYKNPILAYKKENIETILKNRVEKI